MPRAQRSRWVAIVLGVVALALGALIYARYRSEIAAEGWLRDAGLGALPRALRQASRALPALPRRLVEILPDGLFAFAASGLLAALWWEPRRARTIAVVVGALFATAYEIAQGLGLAPGTFDVADVVAALLGSSLAWLLVRER